MKATGIRVRPATREDAAAIARLLGQLTSRDHRPAAVASALERGEEEVLVAEDAAGVIGVAALQVHQMLHQERPTGRLTVLVVARQHRRRGVGETLLHQVSERAVRAGCAGIELTSGTWREEAHRFYEHLGYTATSLKFWRAL